MIQRHLTHVEPAPCVEHLQEEEEERNLNEMSGCNLLILPHPSNFDAAEHMMQFGEFRLHDALMCMKSVAGACEEAMPCCTSQRFEDVIAPMLWEITRLIERIIDAGIECKN